MRKLLKKILMLILSLIPILFVPFMCLASSNADSSDVMPSDTLFTVGGVLTVRYSPLFSVYRRDVEVEIEPSLYISNPIIDGGCYTQREWFSIFVRKLLGYPNFSMITNVRFSSELPPPELIKKGYVRRDIVEGYIAYVSVLNGGTGVAVTLQPVNPVDGELLCRP